MLATENFAVVAYETSGDTVRADHIEEVGEEIARLAAHIHAATQRMLALITPATTIAVGLVIAAIIAAILSAVLRINDLALT